MYSGLGATRSSFFQLLLCLFLLSFFCLVLYVNELTVNKALRFLRSVSCVWRGSSRGERIVVMEGEGRGSYRFCRMGRGVVKDIEE